MIRQGLIAEGDLMQKMKQKQEEAEKEKQVENVNAKMRATKVGFAFQDVGDPSLNKLKEDIRQKEI